MRLLTFRQFKFSRASDTANFVAFVNKQNNECRVLKDKVNLPKAQGSFFEPKPYGNRIKYMTFRPLTSLLSARWDFTMIFSTPYRNWMCTKDSFLGSFYGIRLARKFERLVAELRRVSDRSILTSTPLNIPL